MVPEQNGTYLREITSRLRLPVIPAQAGIQGTKPPTVQLDPGLRRDDGGFGLSKRHSCQSTFIPDTDPVISSIHSIAASTDKRKPRFILPANQLTLSHLLKDVI